MSFTGLLIGSFLQLALGGATFLFAVFLGAGIANGSNLSKVHLNVLGIMCYLLPLSSLVSIGIIVHQYNQSGVSVSYWWHALPLPLIVMYIVYTILIGAFK